MGFRLPGCGMNHCRGSCAGGFAEGRRFLLPGAIRYPSVPHCRKAETASRLRTGFREHKALETGGLAGTRDTQILTEPNTEDIKHGNLQ